MQKINKLLTWPILLVILWSSTALAATDIPSPDTDAAAWAKLVYEALTAKAWTPLSGLAMVALVYPLRRWGGLLVPWFKTSFGGLTLGFVVALLATLGASLAAGAHVSLSLVAVSLSTAAASAGIWEWIKAHVPGMQEAADRSAAPENAA